MSKFRVNQKVVRKVDGKEGVVRAREVKSVENYTGVKYLVDFGDGIENWQVVERKDIVSAEPKKKEIPYIIHKYDVGDGKMITMAAHVNVEKDYAFSDYMEYFKIKTKTLSIGFSLYNGVDEFNEELGKKYAIHRCKTNPFTTMTSNFTGEFNEATILAIMDAKAKYIIDNIDNFYRPIKDVEVVNGDPSVVDKK